MCVRFCQPKEPTYAGKRFVCVDCVGRRVPPSAVCDSRVDNGYASFLGTWPPRASSPSRCNICCARDATMFRDAVVDDIKNRWGPLLVCKDFVAACPWVVELRRASPADFRSALPRSAGPRVRHARPRGRVGPGKRSPLGWNAVAVDGCSVLGRRRAGRKGSYGVRGSDPSQSCAPYEV